MAYDSEACNFVFGVFHKHSSWFLRLKAPKVFSMSSTANAYHWMLFAWLLPAPLMLFVAGTLGSDLPDWRLCTAFSALILFSMILKLYLTYCANVDSHLATKRACWSTEIKPASRTTCTHRHPNASAHTGWRGRV